MNCLRCEVARAKLIAAGMSIVGKSLFDITQSLNDRYGAHFKLVDNAVIYRNNSPVDIHIWGEHGNGKY